MRVLVVDRVKFFQKIVPVFMVITFLMLFTIIFHYGYYTLNSLSHFQKLL